MTCILTRIVLINNAAQNFFFDKEKPVKDVYTDTYAANVSSVVTVTENFLPLLRAARAPVIINVSSAGGSISRQLGRTRTRGPGEIAYCASKTALNFVTVGLLSNESAIKEEERVKYHLVCPGFVSTAFNGFMQGGKTPFQGAEVVVKLLEAKEEYEAGRLWQFEEEQMKILDW